MVDSTEKQHQKNAINVAVSLVGCSGLVFGFCPSAYGAVKNRSPGADRNLTDCRVNLIGGGLAVISGFAGIALGLYVLFYYDRSHRVENAIALDQALLKKVRTAKDKKSLTNFFVNYQKLGQEKKEELRSALAENVPALIEDSIEP